VRSLERHWIRHTATVPKGFLRYQVLELLSEKPLSGSEIISEIEKRTEGLWKPSPGSIYPLLAWLQDNNYIEELAPEGNNVKRYILTENGEALLQEQRRIKKQLRKEARSVPPPILGALWFRIPPEKTRRLRESMRRLVSAFFELGSDLEENFSDQALEETWKVLDDTASKIEEVRRRLKAKQAQADNQR